MITEDYCSYEVAKLLKEKGFDWQTEFVWYEHLPSSIDWRNKINQKAIDYFYFNETTEHNSYYRNCDKKPSYINGDIYSAPTHQMAMKWLRGLHNKHCDVGYDIDLKWFFQIIDLKETVTYDYPETKYYHTENETGFNSYEEAVEAALKYCLTNLI